MTTSAPQASVLGYTRAATDGFLESAGTNSLSDTIAPKIINVLRDTVMPATEPPGPIAACQTGMVDQGISARMIISAPQAIVMGYVRVGDDGFRESAATNSLSDTIAPRIINVLQAIVMPATEPPGPIAACHTIMVKEEIFARIITNASRASVMGCTRVGTDGFLENVCNNSEYRVFRVVEHSPVSG